MIEVRLFAALREDRRKEAAILLINGFHKKPENEDKDGEISALYPPVGGG